MHKKARIILSHIDIVNKRSLTDRVRWSIIESNMMYRNEEAAANKSCSDEQLCALAQQGDRAAEELLATRYFSVVKACSRPYFLAGGDGEDLIQEGMLGLLKAVRAFSPERGVPFEAFARMCVMRRIYSAVSEASAAKHEPLNRAERIAKTPLFDETVETGQATSDPAHLVIGAEEHRERQQKLMSLLSAFEARVLALYLDGCSYEEMAAEVGKPVKSVDNAIQRIRRKAASLLSEHR